MAGKAWQQEFEAAGHVASTARKQRDVNAGACLMLSFLCSSESSVWDGAAT